MYNLKSANQVVLIGYCGYFRGFRNILDKRSAFRNIVVILEVLEIRKHLI